MKGLRNDITDLQMQSDFFVPALLADSRDLSTRGGLVVN